MNPDLVKFKCSRLKPSVWTGIVNYHAMVSNAPQKLKTTVLMVPNGITGNGEQKFKKRLMCAKCQEIENKEEEAAKKSKSLVRTKLKPREGRKWASPFCKLHARLAGRSKEKLFDIAGKMQNQHQQKKLPFTALNKSQLQMAEVSQGSEENPLRNSMEE